MAWWDRLRQIWLYTTFTPSTRRGSVRTHTEIASNLHAAFGPRRDTAMPRAGMEMTSYPVLVEVQRVGELDLDPQEEPPALPRRASIAPTLAWNRTPVGSTSARNASNSAAPGPPAPAPMNHGSTTSVNFADGTSSSTICRAWYLQNPRREAHTAPNNGTEMPHGNETETNLSRRTSERPSSHYTFKERRLRRRCTHQPMPRPGMPHPTSATSV